ncbi:MAG: hypothetical protein KDK03_12380 [Rhodobacteraceae bacterium]|nr:hypothetical protein [Paracoccaceae bacterium]
MRRAAVFLAMAALAAVPAGAQSVAERLNDYPTEARADYVFACMAANGQTREMLRKCSCSVDHVAAILPYDDYVEAETVLSMQQVGGERMSIFRTTQMAKNYVAALRRAQAEAEILCF